MSLSAPRLSPFGEEFGYVEQMLRLQLNAPSLTVDEMYDISLKPINVQFENFAKTLSNTNIVDVFVPVSQLKQSKSDIISYGIKVHPKDGFAFKVGGIDLDYSQDAFELVHMKINLGKVIIHQDLNPRDNLDLDRINYLNYPPTVSNIPEGYNSIRISEDAKHVVFSAAQIKAQHIVRFVWVDGVSDADPVVNTCDKCRCPNASIYCRNCNKRLCQSCNNEIHLSSKFFEDHQQEALAEALLNIQKCPEHKDYDVQYYCPKCNQPICVQCKVRGNHAHGECAKHKLVPLAKAYSDAMALLKRPCPVFTSREQALVRALCDTEDALREVTNNQVSVEEEIMRIAHKAIEDSRLQSAKSAQKIKSARIEIMRKKSELDKQRCLLENYRRNAEPVPFLQTHFRNACLNANIRDNVDLPGPIDAKGDLIVYGRVEVSPPKSRGNANKERHNKSVLTAKGRAHRGDDGDSSCSYNASNYTETDSTTLEPKTPQYTRLEKMAARKLAKYNNANVTLQFRPFEGSEILVDPAVAERLYLCFPFKAQPETHMLFSSRKNGRNIRAMHKLIDNVGITCVLVRANGQVFGGFAASKWTSNGVPKRDRSSTFLFQINKDAFIPYGGKSEDPCYMYATPDTLTFGREDLVLAGNFDKCSSTLENSFTAGFLYDSKKAKEFMANTNKFSADIVEVWGFFTSE